MSTSRPGFRKRSLDPSDKTTSAAKRMPKEITPKKQSATRSIAQKSPQKGNKPIREGLVNVNEPVDDYSIDKYIHPHVLNIFKEVEVSSHAFEMINPSMPSIFES